MPSLEVPPFEKAVILTLAFRLRLHAKLHFLANGGLKNVLFICTNWLPVLYSISVPRPSGPMVSQKDKGNMIIGVIHRYRWDRRDTRSPNLRVKRSKAGNLPSLLVTNTSNFAENS